MAPQWAYTAELLSSGGNAFERIQTLAEALQRNKGKTEGLDDTLSQIRDFEGICDRILIDKNGDAYRNTFIMTNENGKYAVIEKQAPIIAP